jgi:DNA-binding response OmpR family regulator
MFSTIALLFPIGETRAVPIADLSRNPQPKRALRIAVADDDRDALVAHATLLRREGHQVTAIYRASAALDIVRRCTPDVVILDIDMREVTGAEIARQLRDELRDVCPLLIAITAWTEPAGKGLATLVGFHHYLMKPCSSDALLDLLVPLSGRAPSAPRPDQADAVREAVAYRHEALNEAKRKGQAKRGR